MQIIEIMAILPVIIIWRSNTQNKILNSGCVNTERKKNLNNNGNVNDNDENCNEESKSLVVELL